MAYAFGSDDLCSTKPTKDLILPIQPGSLRRIALSEITEVVKSLLGQNKGG